AVEKIQPVQPKLEQKLSTEILPEISDKIILAKSVTATLSHLADLDQQAIQTHQPLVQHQQDEQQKNNTVVNEIIHEADLALQKENNAWSRLQAGMQMNSVMNNRVKVQLDWFLAHRDYLNRVMKRASPILPFILDVVSEKNLPSEMALLPIVESAYQAFAYSHGRASGMWQIIPSTGKYLGLKQNWWYDGRRDIIESTHAATNYLQTLAKQFDNDWELALASYNAGPGKIRSAIRYNKKKGKKTDFWHLTRIRRETKDYVPKLLALKELFANPEKYQLDLLHVEDEQSYDIVELDSQIDLALAADLAGITTEELYQMNPAFNRWATAPKGPHRLLLPKENTQQFKDKLAQLPKNKRVNWVRYKIKNGDTLSQIARKYRTSTTLIKNVNKIKKSNIRAGKYLLIPTSTKSLKQYSLSKSSRLSKIKNVPRSGKKITHTVKSGDSFWSISRKYNVKTRSVAKWNGMAPIDTLRIGQKLVIWKKTSAKAQRVSLVNTSPQQKMHALRYTVRKGDSLSRIADKFNLRVTDIKKWNKVGKYLQPGQKLKLYVDITRQSG
ncbi:MAG: LysM peptidoglycan-binding domain-containing protein, partial [Gammaproteobacteria bacterium]|nr:LysM peptidoglycan-binding domain-containing protein [Gammaproteobacteria bacterium]